MAIYANGLPVYNYKSNQVMLKGKYGLQEQLLIMIYKLIEKKTSQIFREPVDAVVLPDYYQKIKNPIDIATMVKKLKGGNYEFASELKDDLNLMMANCRLYNVRLDVLRTVDKFQRSIETEWGNFQREVKRKDININYKLNVTEDTLKNFEAIEDKNTNKKPSNLQSVLGELQISKKSVAQYRILPPIPAELIQNDRNQNELPKTYSYNPMKYISLKSQQKQKMLSFTIGKEEIGSIFEEAAAKKIAKYKKILLKKVMWIETKIMRKCLQRKRFKKMSTPQFLSSYIEGGEIAANLQLRKLQMYVKMVAYWIEEYPQILSYSMKNKFIDTCRSIKRSIFRVLRYRKVPRSTKIQLDLNFNEAEMMKEENVVPMQAQSKQEMLGEEQSRRYDNEIKSFKRMLNKDQGETIKKYTKIMIKNENGEFAVFDWNIENNDKKKTNRNASISRTQQNTEETMRMQKEKRKREEKEQDEQFLANFRTKNNADIIQSYHSMLWIDWDEIKMRKLPKSIEIDFSKLVIT